MMNGRSRILVVDDDARNLRLLEAVLAPLGHDVLLAPNGQEALEVAGRDSVDLILLDGLMPGIDGFEVARRLKASEATRSIPIVLVAALSDVEHRIKALEAGADDFLHKPVDGTELRARVRSLLKVKAYHDHMRNHQEELEAEVARRTRDLSQSLNKLRLASLETINRLSFAAEYKDEDTGQHIIRMSRYSAAIARQRRLDESVVELILYASPMHDIGKIGIPDYILLKPGKLDAGEWETMKKHTTIGAKILQGSDSDAIRMAERIAITHHEKWDGSGYPRGLRGEDIPIEGRITALADVFDALTTKRPYKEPFSVEKSLSIISGGRGAHFDPQVTEAFFSVKDEILAIRDAIKDM